MVKLQLGTYKWCTMHTCSSCRSPTSQAIYPQSKRGEKKSAKMDAVLRPNITRKPVPQYGLQVSFKEWFWEFSSIMIFFFLADSKARDLSPPLPLKKEGTILVWSDNISEGWCDSEAGNISLNCLKFVSQLVSPCLLPSEKVATGMCSDTDWSMFWLRK